MSEITGLTRGGIEYLPRFVLELNQQKCIGCGRCYKVCSRAVFELVEREAGADDEDDWDDDDDDDDCDDGVTKVMSLANALDCIGCEACSRVCPKGCMTHGASSVVSAG